MRQGLSGMGTPRHGTGLRGKEKAGSRQKEKKKREGMKRGRKEEFLPATQPHKNKNSISLLYMSSISLLRFPAGGWTTHDPSLPAHSPYVCLPLPEASLSPPLSYAFPFSSLPYAATVPVRRRRKHLSEKNSFGSGGQWEGWEDSGRQWVGQWHWLIQLSLLLLLSIIFYLFYYTCLPAQSSFISISSLQYYLAIPIYAWHFLTLFLSSFSHIHLF